MEPVSTDSPPIAAAKATLWQRGQGLMGSLVEGDRWDKMRIVDSMSVRASLRFAFASVLAGALVIGVFRCFRWVA